MCCELLSNFLYFCSRNNIFDWWCWFYSLWIALKFFVLLQSKQQRHNVQGIYQVVNCSQIFCTFAVETTLPWLKLLDYLLWIALKFFVLLQSKQLFRLCYIVKSRCELLSNFLYFCSRNNEYSFSSTTFSLWIALKFFVLLQSKQHVLIRITFALCCELLSNFLYFCSRNNFIVYL